jgi:hypothetical protein
VARITSKIFPEKDLCIYTIDGSASRDDLLNIVINIKPEQRTNHVIWDASNGTVETIGKDDLRSIAKFLKSGHGMRAGGKTGLVGPEDLDYGIGRMFQAYASLENLAVEYRIFRTLDEALAWID